MSRAAGVSVVVCSHNGASRLPATLAQLADQAAGGVPWEVLLIDNASTDGSGQAAVASWPRSAPAPLRVVAEPRPGLSHARVRGLEEARYEFVGFVDDDNWVAADWVQRAHDVPDANPEAGACGGSNEAVLERDPPPWFGRYQSAYAVGSQGPESGDVTDSRGYLWGAGLAVRHSAWRRLRTAGFAPLMEGRRGRRLGAGEDMELCLALRLAGWRLWFDPSLRLCHCISGERMQLPYFYSMMRGFGRSSVYRRIYSRVLARDLADGPVRWREEWSDAFKQLLVASMLRWSRGSSDDAVARPALWHRQLGRFQETTRLAGAFTRVARQVSDLRAALDDLRSGDDTPDLNEMIGVGAKASTN